MPVPSVFGILLSQLTAGFPCCLHPDNKSLLHLDRVERRLDFVFSEVRRSQGKNWATNRLPGGMFVWHIIRNTKKSKEDSNCRNVMPPWLCSNLGVEQEDLDQVFSPQLAATLIH
jgi:hypothetical protein